MFELHDTPPLAPNAVRPDIRVLDADAVVQQIVAQRATASAAQAAELALAVHFVDLHPVTDDEAAPLSARLAASTHDPALDPELADDDALGGEGTPAIAQFAVESLGAALGVPYLSALRLVSESVALCYRFPQLWARVQDGRLSAWQARGAARSTMGLSLESAGFVDRQLAILCDRGRWPSLRKLADLVHEGRLRDDPDHERGVEEAALNGCGVWFDHRTSDGNATTTGMTATLDAFDAFELDATLSDLAGTMGRLGDTSSQDQRRAQALTLITHPQQLLDLAHASDAGATAEPGDSGSADRSDSGPADRHDSGSADGAGHTDRGAASGSSCTPRRGRKASVVLHVHASLADLAACPAVTGTSASSREPDGDLADADDFRAGLVLVERFGPALAGVVARWAGRTDRVVVRPVLDPTGVLPDRDTTATRPVDQHDPPEAMREHVVLRDGQCVFPGCGIDARRCDLDHIDPYVELDEGGPPGQTHPGNLACLCRRHHRLKTFTAWDYERHHDGTFTWTDARGTAYGTQPVPLRAPQR